jgi:hypothetical protein
VDNVSAVQELRALVATYLEGSDDAPRAIVLLDAIDSPRPSHDAQGPLVQAKEAAHDAYLAANRALAVLDETADQAWISRAEAVRENAWQLYTALVLETEW